MGCGEGKSGMEVVPRHGLTVQCTKVDGKMEVPLVSVDLNLPTVMFTKENS